MSAPAATASLPATAALIVIGNEILSGRTRDANLPFLAERLLALGIRLREARIVPDEEDAIISAVNALRERYRYVFTTGGIGPTHDDITADCIAKAFGVALEEHPEALARLRAHYSEGDLNAARRRMALIPAGARLIDNPISMAPGFQIDNVFVLPGVPMILQAMFDMVAPRLAGGPPVMSRTVSCLLAEGQIAEGLAAIQRRHPEIEIGSYPYLRNRQYGVSLVLRGTDLERLDAATQEVCALVRALGGDPIVLDGAA